MLGSSDPTQAKGKDYKVRELLEDLERELGGQLAQEPEVEADLRLVMANCYRGLAQPAKAQPHAELAVGLRQQVLGPANERVGNALYELARTLVDQGKHEEATRILERARAT